MRRLRGSGAAAALLLALAACGDGASTGATPEAETSAPTPTSVGSATSSGAAEAVEESSRAEVLRAAERAVVEIVSIDHGTYEADIADDVELLTDAFAREFRRTKDEARAGVLRDQTVVEVRNVATGLSAHAGDRAEVVVFLDQYTLATGTRTVTPYSVLVTLVLEQDRWLVDALATDTGGRMQEVDDGRAAALRGAADLARALQNLSHDSVDEDVERIRALATGTFGEEFEAGLADLVTATREAESVTRGKVTMAGLETFDGDRATALVRTSGTVANRATGGEDETRTYRLRISVTLVDGAWLTEDLQYVVAE